jgi:hypothetical protein
MRRRFWILAPLLALVIGCGAATLLRGKDGPAAEAERKEPAGDKADRQQLLQAVGLLAASHLYQAYLNIGFMADGKAEGTYTEKDIKEILGTVLALLDGLDKQLDKVGKQELTKEDRQALDEIRRLAGLLQEQGKELQAFWSTGDKSHGDRYEKLRQEAWQGISKLMKLEKAP